MDLRFGIKRSRATREFSTKLYRDITGGLLIVHAPELETNYAFLRIKSKLLLAQRCYASIPSVGIPRKMYPPVLIRIPCLTRTSGIFGR